MVRPNRQHRQYSYYVIDAMGVLDILVTQEYQWIIIVRNAMQRAMN